MVQEGVKIYASRLAGKEVVSMATGSKLGVVHDILVNNDELVAFLVDSEEELKGIPKTGDGLYIIPISAFRSVGDVVVVDTSAIRPLMRIRG